MSSDVALRVACPDDLSAVASLLELLGEGVDVDPLRIRLGQPGDDSIVIVAERGGDVVGMAAARVGGYLATSGRPAQLEALAVRPDARRQRVGTHLVEALDLWATDRGCTVLWLFTDFDRTAAHELYRRTGWSATGLRFVRPTSPPPDRAVAPRDLVRMMAKTVGFPGRRAKGTERAAAARSTRPVVPTWTMQRIVALLDGETNDEARDCFAILAGTGITPYELHDLRWEAVDLAASRIMVRRPTDRYRRMATPSPDRTPLRPRLVAIDDGTADAFRRLALVRIAGRLVSRYTPSQLEGLFRNACERLGVAPVEIDVLRHTHASVLLDAGCAPVSVAERLGFEDSALLLDYYGRPPGAAADAWTNQLHLARGSRAGDQDLR